jgi:ribosomal protein L11 methyltransferase
MAWVVRCHRAGSPERSADNAGLLDEFAVLLSQLWDSGMTGVSEHQVDGRRELIAGFHTRDDAVAASARAAAHELTTEVHPADKSWFPTGSSTVAVPGTNNIITISAGPSFGHGDHPTTALVIEMLGQLGSISGSALDLGTGSGVLAIAVALLGAEPVTAIDIDPTAVEIAAENAAANNVAIEVSATAPSGLVAPGRQFDLILANVLVTVHEGTADQVGRLLAPHGRLVVSGFLDEQADRVRKAYRQVMPDIQVDRVLASAPWQADLMVRAPDR